MSASAAFAAEDADIAAAVDNDDNDDIVASVDKESSLGSKEAKNDVLKASQEITPENINQYVDKNGVMNTTLSEIEFKGTFNGNTTFKEITFNNGTKITGDATFNNISFYFNKTNSNISITGIKFVQENGEYAIRVSNATAVSMNDLNIDYKHLTPVTSSKGFYAIAIEDIKNITIENCVINYDNVITDMNYFYSALRILQVDVEDAVACN